MRQFVGTGESALYRVSVVPTRLLLRGAQNEAGSRASYAPVLGHVLEPASGSAQCAVLRVRLGLKLGGLWLAGSGWSSS